MESLLPNCSKSSVVRQNLSLKATTDKLYEQRNETGDIKFNVGTEEIPAHRCVLAALSPRYKAQFYGTMAEQNPINVQDVSPAAFKEFLQLFYLEEVTLTLENIEDVLNLAKQSLADELVFECTNFLLDAIGLDKLLWCYRLATQYEIEPLGEFCSGQISEKIRSLFQSPEFLSCDHAMLCHILDFDLLNCNEMDVFDACIAWARAKCEHDGIDVANATHLRAALGDAIFKIRFCSMTGEQFATIGKAYGGLLSGPESIEVYQAILLKASGEISSIFGANNSKPRKPKLASLECSFSKGFPARLDSDKDFLDFTCDKAIFLNGFVVCNKIENIATVRVETAGVKQRMDFTKSTSDNETRIIFDTPKRVAAKRWCRIQIKPEAKIRIGFPIENIVQQNDVSFEFGIGFKPIKSITRLLYNSNSIE